MGIAARWVWSNSGMNKTLPLLALVLASPAAWADDAGLRNCRAIALASARLACYDALPLAAAGSTSPVQNPVAQPRAVPAATPAATPIAAAPATSATPSVASFGLETPGEKLQEIRSRIPGLFEGWRAGDRIRLANGQVWRVVDDSRADYYLRDPQVTVRRGALGSYLMDIEGANHLPRVRRVE